MKRSILILVCVALLCCLGNVACTNTAVDAGAAVDAKQQAVEFLSKIELGAVLFNDVALSKDGQQACATCHQAAHAFVDARQNQTSAYPGLPGAVSLGQDNRALGDINTPTLSYVALTPAFYFDQDEKLFKGGFFLNGRAHTLADQVKEPFLNPVEMQTNPEAVVAAVKSRYAPLLQTIYGKDVFSSTDKAFDAIADALASFLSSPQFASFDSKFDKVLKGQASFTPQEQRGHDLFVAEDKGNCAACHPVPDINSSLTASLFTDFSYDNLGVPKNYRVRGLNGKTQSFVDKGLFDNPAVSDPDLQGAFRVPTLRNVAVTAPYMHNGVFHELSSVVEFYNTRDVKGAINPETSREWEPAEIESTKNIEELGDLKLSKEEVAAIVAFMNTLTDARYQHLIKK